MKETLESIFQKEFSPSYLQVTDQSHLHAGHQESRPGGGTHFSVTIVSESFRGKGRLERHRRVYDLIFPRFEGRIHALAVKAYIKEEWEKVRAEKGR